MTQYDLKAILVAVYQKYYEQQFSVDALIQNTQMAHEYCEKVREVLGDSSIDDSEINNILMRWRKGGKKL